MSGTNATWSYNVTRRGYAIASVLILIGSPLFDAPFGKFASSPNRWGNKLTVNTNAAFMVFESTMPATLIWTFMKAPISLSGTPPPLRSPASLLAGLVLLHYIHRAIIQPLRSPTRTPSHIIIPLASILYNLVNGRLLGTFLSSGQVAHDSWNTAGFWAGIALFFTGMVGNIYHDELLIRLRKSTHKPGKPQYGIPHGGLFSLISYPNYFCEWCEWLGFAVAASVGLRSAFYLTPPWLFLGSEICVMLPRAISGHRWYKKKFEDYPQSRKAVVPFVL